MHFMLNKQTQNNSKIFVNKFLSTAIVVSCYRHNISFPHIDIIRPNEQAHIIMAWYNTYRPQTFDDVIGQELVKSVLQNSLLKDKIKHAYLLNGPKGVGKTTLARIFANQLNDIATKSESKIDIIEMDAASNTGIDDIRQLIESAKIPPISGKYKIFIIDEVHMLSKSAMNALLKILEEPPTYIVFLLATTNPEKLIPTVLSRLTKLNLSAHTEQDIISRLQYIASKEKLTIDESALKIIAKRSGGSQRDAINLMETLSAYELDKYNKNNTAELLGLLPEELMEQVSYKIFEGHFDTELINLLEKTGIDGESMLVQLLEFLLDKSFDGDNNLDSLVLPVASLLEAKLPVTNIVSVLALVQVKLNSSSLAPLPIKSTPAILAQPIVQKLPPTLTEEPAPKKSTVSIKPSIQPLESEAKPKPEKVINPVETQLGSDEASVDSVKSTITTLSKDSASPPIFKMLVPDLVVEKVEGLAVTFSVSNGIFVAQLGSEKLQTWLKEKLNQTIAINRINVMQRDAVAQVIQMPTQPGPEIQEIPSHAYEEEMVAPGLDSIKKPVKPDKIEEKKKPKAVTGKIFYKVYDELPEEIKDSKIPIYLGEIPDPEPKKDGEDGWDNHVDDMFEFE
jgi:DNA polymerase III subunit gamma/tau